MEIEPDEVDTSTPIGSYRRAWVGYSGDEEIRSKAASGGVVTAVLSHLLASGIIQGALVCAGKFKDGSFGFDVRIATSKKELLECQSSKYFDIPILRGLEQLKEFEGRVAVVGLPSQINALSRRMAKNAFLRTKIAFRIALFCGHNSKQELIERIWEKKKIEKSEIESFKFRQGHWRGKMEIQLKSGEIRRFPFQDFSHYQNLHILSLDRCLNCHDHMGYYSDLATGDVWMRKMKGNPIKHSVFLARTAAAEGVIESMLSQKLLVAEEVNREFVYKSQKRSINYHYNLTARAKIGRYFGIKVRDRVGTKCRLRDYVAALIVVANHRLSKNKRMLDLFMRLPKPIVAGYLYLFKALVNYERKNY